GHEASALCMDKLRTKQVLEAEGIPTPRWKVVRSGDVDPGINFDRAVVKPRREGSSIGMSIVPSDEVSSAIQKARNFGSDVIVEEYMDGYEATVGVVGLESVEILPPVGIRPSHDFFDYETKYTKGLTEYDVPADLPDNVKQELREITARTVNAFEAQSLCRVDFILDEEHNPYVLELNTIPGLTETSLLPKAARLDGMSFEQLVWNLVCHAEEEQLWEVA
ncbi:MAG: ATP-grasp domain-containing protein, partial [bacterium]